MKVYSFFLNQEVSLVDKKRLMEQDYLKRTMKREKKPKRMRAYVEDDEIKKKLSHKGNVIFVFLTIIFDMLIAFLTKTLKCFRKLFMFYGSPFSLKTKFLHFVIPFYCALFGSLKSD